MNEQENYKKTKYSHSSNDEKNENKDVLTDEKINKEETTEKVVSKKEEIEIITTK